MNRKPWEKDEEYMSYVGELLKRKEIQQLKEYNHHYYNNRLNHSIGVSYKSYRVAKKVGADAKAVARAGLLHDMYYYDRSISKEVLNGSSHNKVHPKIAVQNAKQLTELSEIEQDIIEKHMWGATNTRPKYKESYIVTMIDKWCAMTDLTIPIKKKWNRMVSQNFVHRKYHRTGI